MLVGAGHRAGPAPGMRSIWEPASEAWAAWAPSCLQHFPTVRSPTSHKASLTPPPPEPQNGVAVMVCRLNMHKALRTQ